MQFRYPANCTRQLAGYRVLLDSSYVIGHYLGEVVYFSGKI